MNIDVELYMSNILKFFKENPDDLNNLVSKSKEQEFYQKIREVAIKNYENGEDVTLTQSQIMKVCYELKNETNGNYKIFHRTILGEICLN